MVAVFGQTQPEEENGRLSTSFHQRNGAGSILLPGPVRGSFRILPAPAGAAPRHTVPASLPKRFELPVGFDPDIGILFLEMGFQPGDIFAGCWFGTSRILTFNSPKGGTTVFTPGPYTLPPTMYFKGGGSPNPLNQVRPVCRPNRPEPVGFFEPVHLKTRGEKFASFPRPWEESPHRKTREWSRGRFAHPRTTARLRINSARGFWPRRRSTRNARRSSPYAGSAEHPITRATRGDRRALTRDPNGIRHQDRIGTRDGAPLIQGILEIRTADSSSNSQRNRIFNATPCSTAYLAARSAASAGPLSSVVPRPR